MRAGRGYSILNGLVYLLAAMFGLIAVISALIPVAVVAPILVFVGMSMVSTAFQTNAKKYYPAVALAMLPYFANYVMTRFNNAAGEVVSRISDGIVPLGQGAMFTAMMLGAITVCVIDGAFKRAMAFALCSAGFSFVGLMHAPKLAFYAAPDYVMGYLVMALLFAWYAFRGVVKRDDHYLGED